MGFFFHLCGIRGYLHFKSTQCGYLIRFQTDSRCSCSWRRISPNSGHQYSCRAEESARRRAGGGSVPAALPLSEKLRLRMAHRSSDGWSISIPHIWIYIGRTSLSDTEHLWTFFFYLCGTQVCLILWERWDGPDGPGPHGACGAAWRCCLNMLNDIKIEDRLRTDASSLEVLLGECSPPPEPFSSSEHSWTVFSFVEEKKKMWTWLNKLFDFVCFVCSSYIWSFGLRSLNCYLNSFFFLCCSTAQKSCFIFDSVRCGSKQASVISAHSFCWVLEDVRTLGIC